jgi:hypothetical protein
MKDENLKNHLARSQPAPKGRGLGAIWNYCAHSAHSAVKRPPLLYSVANKLDPLGF